MLVAVSVFEGSTASNALTVYGEYITLSAFVENEPVPVGLPVSESIFICTAPLPLEALAL